MTLCQSILTISLFLAHQLVIKFGFTLFRRLGPKLWEGTIILTTSQTKSLKPSHGLLVNRFTWNSRKKSAKNYGKNCFIVPVRSIRAFVRLFLEISKKLTSLNLDFCKPNYIASWKPSTSKIKKAGCIKF